MKPKPLTRTRVAEVGLRAECGRLRGTGKVSRRCWGRHLFPTLDVPSMWRTSWHNPPGFSLVGWVWVKDMGVCSSALFSYGELTTGVGVRRHFFWGAGLCLVDGVAQCCMTGAASLGFSTG